MARLLCIGEVLVEMIAARPDQTHHEPGEWMGPYPSGAPAILADQAALCGAEAALAGSVGDDAFGRACLDQLRADGVDIAGVRVVADAATGVAFVSYRSDGSRSFLFHLADTASGRFGEAAVAPGGADCLHLMGSSAFSPSAVAALEAAFQAALDGGTPVSFDPNVRPEMLTRESYVAALKRILAGSAVVLASEGELPLLMGGGSDEACAEDLLSGAAEAVVLKRGERGARLLLPGEVIEAPGLDVEEVDATGAGDCFGGTFLALRLGGAAPERALRLANVAGALAVTKRGPMAGNRPLADLEAAEGELRPRRR